MTGVTDGSEAVGVTAGGKGAGSGARGLLFEEPTRLMMLVNRVERPEQIAGENREDSRQCYF